LLRFSPTSGIRRKGLSRVEPNPLRQIPIDGYARIRQKCVKIGFSPHGESQALGIHRGANANNAKLLLFPECFFCALSGIGLGGNKVDDDC